MITYLDNSATTRVCEQAAQAAARCMREQYGNPSSLHTLGLEAERELRAAREAVASLLRAPGKSIVFTSGGTEANNLAILGGGAANARAGRHAVTTAMEHPAVSACFDELETQGWTITRLRPDPSGTLSAAAIADACRADTALVSVMLVNNETGARLPVEEALPQIRARAPRALVHTDAVQAAGRIPLPKEVDLLSLSGHKLHAPKGVGALYIHPGVRLRPRQLGGGQESGLRGGTEAVPLIAALGAAVGALPGYAAQAAHFAALRERLLRGLAEVEGVRLLRPDPAVDYIISLSAPGLRSETLLHALAQREVYVSSGSACSGGKRSVTLTAWGIPPAEADAALRVSLSRENTPADIDRFLHALTAVCRTLIHR